MSLHGQPKPGGESRFHSVCGGPDGVPFPQRVETGHVAGPLLAPQAGLVVGQLLVWPDHCVTAVQHRGLSLYHCYVHRPFLLCHSLSDSQSQEDEEGEGGGGGRWRRRKRRT